MIFISAPFMDGKSAVLRCFRRVVIFMQVFQSQAREQIKYAAEQAMVH